MERIDVEVRGQVFLALGGPRVAESLERGLLRDERHVPDLGQGSDPETELLDFGLRRRRPKVGDHFDLLLDELKPGQESVLDDEEPGQEQQHQGHGGGRGKAHGAVPPEALPGTRQAEHEEPDHAVSPAGGSGHRPRRG